MWVYLTVRTTMIHRHCWISFSRTPRGDGRYCCCYCWTPRAPEHIQKSNIQHWDRNSKFHLFSHDGYVPSLDFDDILRDKIRISRRIFWCCGFAVAPMLKKCENSVLLPKNGFLFTRIKKKMDFCLLESRTYFCLLEYIYIYIYILIFKY